MSSILSLFSSQPAKSFFLMMQRSCFSHEHIFGKFLIAGNQIVTSWLLAMTYTLGGFFVPTWYFVNVHTGLRQDPINRRLTSGHVMKGARQYTIQEICHSLESPHPINRAKHSWIQYKNHYKYKNLFEPVCQITKGGGSPEVYATWCGVKCPCNTSEINIEGGSSSHLEVYAKCTLHDTQIEV